MVTLAGGERKQDWPRASELPVGSKHVAAAAAGSGVGADSPSAATQEQMIALCGNGCERPGTVPHSLL